MSWRNSVPIRRLFGRSVRTGALQLDVIFFMLIFYNIFNDLMWRASL